MEVRSECSLPPSVDFTRLLIFMFRCTQHSCCCCCCSSVNAVEVQFNGHLIVWVSWALALASTLLDNDSTALNGAAACSMWSGRFAIVCVCFSLCFSLCNRGLSVVVSCTAARSALEHYCLNCSVSVVCAFHSERVKLCCMNLRECVCALNFILHCHFDTVCLCVCVLLLF